MLSYGSVQLFCTVTRWRLRLGQTVRSCDSFGGDAARCFAIGGSAGGGLALALTNHLIIMGKKSLNKACVALCPITAHPKHVPEGYRDMYTSYTENADAALIDSGAMESAFGKSLKCYFQIDVSLGTYTGLDAMGVPPDDASTFISLSKHLGEFPPTYITTCEKDILRDDGRLMELKLKEAGSTVVRKHYLGLPHYFWVFPALDEKIRMGFLKDVCSNIGSLLGQRHERGSSNL